MKEADKPLFNQDPSYKNFWETFFTRTHVAPSWQGATIWPVSMINDLQLILYKWEGTNFPHHNDDMIKKNTPEENSLAEKLYPIRESIQNIKTVYRINALQFARQGGLPWIKTYPWYNEQLLRASLESDWVYFDAREAIEPTGAELDIVRRLCEETRFAFDYQGNKIPHPRIPFDPKKKIYRYSEAIDTSAKRQWIFPPKYPDKNK